MCASSRTTRWVNSADRLADRRQAVKRRHRRLELVADAVHVHHQGGRLLHRETAFQEADHPLRGPAAGRTGPRSAWQTAAASASAASAATAPIEAQNAAHHELNLRFFGAARTDHRLLDLARRVLEHFRIGIRRAADGGTARLAELQCAVGIAVHEHPLDGDLLRTVLRDDAAHAAVNLRTDAPQNRPAACGSRRSPRTSSATPPHPGRRSPCIASRDRCRAPGPSPLYSASVPPAAMPGGFVMGVDMAGYDTGNGRPNPGAAKDHGNHHASAYRELRARIPASRR